MKATIMNGETPAKKFPVLQGDWGNPVAYFFWLIGTEKFSTGLQIGIMEVLICQEVNIRTNKREKQST